MSWEQRREMTLSALRAMRPDGDDGPLVNLMLQGAPVVLKIALDWSEHRRRLTHRVGAITSTGLLHALWSIPPSPSGIREVPSSEHLALLRDAPEMLVSQSDNRLTRTYNPAVRVLLVAVPRQYARTALRTALAMPPMFERLALWREHTGPAGHALSSYARDRGIGQLHLRDDREPRTIALPDPPIPATPSVFNWWISEIAYSQLLKNTQDSSWRLGSTSMAPSSS